MFYKLSFLSGFWSVFLYLIQIHLNKTSNPLLPVCKNIVGSNLKALILYTWCSQMFYKLSFLFSLLIFDSDSSQQNLNSVVTCPYKT